jgi:hypothetical protein
MKLKDLNKKIDSLNEAVSMNISMSGDSADDVATLMKMVKDSGGAPEVVKDIPSLGMRGDIEKSMSAIKGLDGPDMGPEGPEDMGDIKAKIMPMPDMGCEDEEVPEGEWDNSPDEQHQDTAYMQNDLAGGLNRPKKSYPKVAGGDNPMALEDEIKAELTAKLGEMMKEEKDAEAKFDEAGCKKKMKKLNASGCTKEDMKKKITAEYGCNKSKFEELYASSCGSH